MPVGIALLRGINVAGSKVVRMEALRESLGRAGLGLENVRTYVQSGNIVFTGGKLASDGKIADRIKTRIQRDFGFDVPVVVRSATELKAIVRRNPFLKEKGIDLKHLHVTFLNGLNGPPSAEGLRKLAAVASGKDRFRRSGAEIYLHCPGGYGETKLSNNVIERLLDCGATTRNWRTLGALLEMAQTP